MEYFYFSTEEPHANNTETMSYFINHINEGLEIIYIEGSYAEGLDEYGHKWELHAGGNGNFNDHVIKFKPMNE